MFGGILLLGFFRWIIVRLVGIFNVVWVCIWIREVFWDWSWVFMGNGVGVEEILGMVGMGLVFFGVMAIGMGIFFFFGVFIINCWGLMVCL